MQHYTTASKTYTKKRKLNAWGTTELALEERKRENGKLLLSYTTKFLVAKIFVKGSYYVLGQNFRQI